MRYSNLPLQPKLLKKKTILADSLSLSARRFPSLLDCERTARFLVVPIDSCLAFDVRALVRDAVIRYLTRT